MRLPGDCPDDRPKKRLGKRLVSESSEKNMVLRVKRTYEEFKKSGIFTVMHAGIRVLYGAGH